MEGRKAKRHRRAGFRADLPLFRPCGSLCLYLDPRKASRCLLGPIHARHSREGSSQPWDANAQGFSAEVPDPNQGLFSCSQGLCHGADPCPAVGVQGQAGVPRAWQGRSCRGWSTSGAGSAFGRARGSSRGRCSPGRSSHLHRCAVCSQLQPRHRGASAQNAVPGLSPLSCPPRMLGTPGQLKAEPHPEVTKRPPPRQLSEGEG